MRLFTILALALAVGLATAASPFASSHPDGLERVADGQGVPRQRPARADPGGRAGARLRVPGRRERAARDRARGLRRHARRVRASASASPPWPGGARSPHERRCTPDRASRATWHSPIHRLDPRAKLIGLAGVTLVAVSTPLTAWPAYVACAATLIVVAALARVSPRTVWTPRAGRAPARPVRRRVRPVRPRGRPGRSRPGDGLRAGPGDVRDGQREGDPRHVQRGPARRDDELPRRPARARAAARAAAADPDRGVHVPLPVRDRRRGARGCARRSRPAATRPGTRCRRPRSAASPPRCSCAPTSAPSACTWRCSRAAGRRRCRA